MTRLATLGLASGTVALVPHDGAWADAFADEAGRIRAALGALPAEVAHVGSTATGRSVAVAAARTGAKVLLENGGNDALIVDAGVDPKWAAEQAALGAFANAGQICVSVERIYVHRSVADEFLDALVAEARKRPSEVPMAPLVDERQRADMIGMRMGHEDRGKLLVFEECQVRQPDR